MNSIPIDYTDFTFIVKILFDSNNKINYLSSAAILFYWTELMTIRKVKLTKTLKWKVKLTSGKTNSKTERLFVLWTDFAKIQQHRCVLVQVLRYQWKSFMVAHAHIE